MAEVYPSPAPPPPLWRRNWKLIGGAAGVGLVLMCACIGALSSYGGQVQAKQTATAEAISLANAPTAEPTPTVAPTTEPTATAVPEPTATPAPTGTPAPTRTPEPTATPEPTLPPTETPVPPTPTLPPAPIVIVGEGQTVTDPVDIPRGIYRLNLSHTGQRNFIVHSFDPDGKEGSISNKIGPYEGQELLVSEGGAWTFEVNADGRWAINPEPIGFDDSVAAGLEAEGDVVTDLFMPTRVGPVPYEFKHDGERNFIVHLICAGGNDGAQNEIGPVDNTAMARFSEGPCLWDVNADGNWSISPR